MAPLSQNPRSESSPWQLRSRASRFSHEELVTALESARTQKGAGPHEEEDYDEMYEQARDLVMGKSPGLHLLAATSLARRL